MFRQNPFSVRSGRVRTRSSAQPRVRTLGSALADVGRDLLAHSARTALALGTLALFTANAHAGVVFTSTTYEEIRGLGILRAGIPALDANGGLLGLTVTAGDQVRNTSATYYNEGFALTAAHNVYDLLSASPTLTVFTGDNYLTNRGVEVAVTEVIFFPTYAGPGSIGDAADIAILRLATKLPGVPAQIGTSDAPGTVLELAGYGQFGYAGSGVLQPITGDALAGFAPIGGELPINVSDVYYNTLNFSRLVTIPANLLGTPGYSGGPVIGPDGGLRGIVQGGIGGVQFTSGRTVYLDFSNTEVRDWILQNTILPPTDGGGDGDGDGDGDNGDGDDKKICKRKGNIGKPCRKGQLKK